MVRAARRRRARDAKIEAIELLGKWTSLSRGHVLMGGNCSCGLGAGSLPIQEFERQILDYLATKAAARGHAGVGKAGSLSALLKSIATAAGNSEPSPWLAVLDDLRQTLESFDDAHRSSKM